MAPCPVVAGAVDEAVTVVVVAAFVAGPDVRSAVELVVVVTSLVVGSAVVTGCVVISRVEYPAVNS